MLDQPIVTLSDLPTPDGSARSDALVGNDLVLADGRTWRLADFIPKFGDPWNRIYDDNLLATRYELIDIHLAGVRLLLANYDLPAEFAVWLIQGAAVDQLRDAIEAAMFGRKDQIRTWSDWAESALWANGINPATLPATQLRPVLDQLVMAGRAVPAVNWTSAGQAYKQRQALNDKFKEAGIKATPYHPPAPPAPSPE